MQQGALPCARRPDHRHELPTLEPQADPVECAHRLTADLILAHHVAEVDGEQFVLGTSAGVDSSEHDPPASPHRSAPQKALMSEITSSNGDRFSQWHRL